MVDSLHKATSEKSRLGKVENDAETDRQEGGIEVTINGIRVALSPELEAAVQRAYNGLLSPLPVEMTTTQAAEFLDVSRPFIIKLVRKRELRCRMVGRNRRIPSTALVEYKERMFRQATAAVDEMARSSQELGLYEPVQPPQTEQ